MEMICTKKRWVRSKSGKATLHVPGVKYDVCKGMFGSAKDKDGKRKVDKDGKPIPADIPADYKPLPKVEEAVDTEESKGKDPDGGDK